MKTSAEQQKVVAEKVQELKLNNRGYTRCPTCGIHLNGTERKAVIWCSEARYGKCPQTTVSADPNPNRYAREEEAQFHGQNS